MLLPKSIQTKAKGHLHDIWQAETRADAEAAFDFFVETYGVKYDKTVAKLVKDREVLLAFYDFPAEHWKHIRTANPIESTFATVRHHRGIAFGTDGLSRAPCGGERSGFWMEDSSSGARCYHGHLPHRLR
jgi:transposase-like protein